MIRLGVYAYEKNDHRLLRMIDSRKYNLVWLCKANEHREALEMLLSDKVDVFLVNPWHEQGLGDYASSVPIGTVVVCQTYPFGHDSIHLPQAADAGVLV